MKKALVLGITGGFGRHMARELVTQGYEVIGLGRDISKLPEDLSNRVRFIAGNVEDAALLDRIIAPNMLIVYGVNPTYQHWQSKAMAYLEAVLTFAEARQSCIVFPANVYVFDPTKQSVFSESDAFQPLDHKGQIRCQMEARLQQASQKGAQVIILRAGDFIGQGADNTWFPMLLKHKKQHFQLRNPGSKEAIHCWAYLPDFCKVAMALVEKHQQLKPYEVFHFKGHEMSFEQMAQQLTNETGKQVRLIGFAWWPLQLISPFAPLIKELLGMRYLWQYSLRLDDAKLESTLADRKQLLEPTPLGKALTEMGMI